MKLNLFTFFHVSCNISVLLFSLRHLWGLVILLAVVTGLVSAVTVIQLTLLADDRGLEPGQALEVIRYVDLPVDFLEVVGEAEDVKCIDY